MGMQQPGRHTMGSVKGNRVGNRVGSRSVSSLVSVHIEPCSVQPCSVIGVTELSRPHPSASAVGRAGSCVWDGACIGYGLLGIPWEILVNILAESMRCLGLFA